MLLQLLVVVVKVAEFFRQNVGVRRQVERRLAVLLLHPHNVKAHAVFARDFGRVGELVQLLVLIQAFVLVALEGATRPEQVPVVALRLRKVVVVEDALDHAVVKADKFEQHFAVLNVVALVVHVVPEVVRAADALLERRVPESDELARVLVLLVVEAGGALRLRRENAALVLGSARTSLRLHFFVF